VCIPRIAERKIVTLLIAIQSGMLRVYLAADCHRSEPSARDPWFIGRGIGIPQCVGELFAKAVKSLWQIAEFSNRGKSSSRYLTLRVPLLEVSYICKELLYVVDFLGLNYTPMVSVETLSCDTVP
jgi:hypothetical protein